MTEQRGFFERWFGSSGGGQRIDDSQHIKPFYGPYIGLWAEGSDPYWRYDPMRYEGDGHQLIIAPSRSGKSRDVLVPSLLTNLDSMFILDVKGELAAITARARMELGHEVYCINPFGLHTGPPWHLPQHGWNPLLDLDPESPNFTSDVESLASALIQHDSAESAHWSEGAKSLVVGLIVHEVLSSISDLAEKSDQSDPRSRWKRMPSLARVREYITMPDDDFETSMRDIVATTKSQLVRDRLTSFTNLTNELRSLKSTARVQSTFLSDAQIAAALTKPDVRFRQLKSKSKPMTVYVILPSRLIARGSTYNRFLRLALQSALDAMTATPKEHNRPVNFLLDEFASLGAMPIVERMMSEGAGFGIQQAIIVQSLAALRDIYKTNYETFIANSACQQWFTPRDWGTAEYLSKMLGHYTTTSQSVNAKGEASTSETGRPLLRPEELMALPEHAQVVLLRNCPNPLMLYRSPYFKATWGLQSKFDRNPYFVE